MMMNLTEKSAYEELERGESLNLKEAMNEW
jgi:hypothetical protein